MRKMSAIDTLIQYILTLSPEQASEILKALPKDGKLSKEEYIAKIIVMLKECTHGTEVKFVFRKNSKNL